MFVYSTNKYANEQIILFQAFTQWYIFQNKNITLHKYISITIVIIMINT